MNFDVALMLFFSSGISKLFECKNAKQKKKKETNTRNYHIARFKYDERD